MSKRRFGTKEQPSASVFFTDRDLGRTIPSILNSHGLHVEPYHKHFKSEKVEDSTWITFIAKRGWIAITHDKSIRHSPDAVEALMRSGARVFVLIGRHPFPTLAGSFVKVHHRVLNILERDKGPFIAKVYTINPENSRAKPTVKIWLTYAQWKAGLRTRAERARK